MNLGVRLPQWNTPGCCVHKIDRISWKWMKDIEVGEKLDNNDLRITRIV